MFKFLQQSLTYLSLTLFVGGLILFNPLMALAASTDVDGCPADYPALSCKIYHYLFVCGEDWQKKPCEIGDLLTLAQGIINTLLFIIVTPVAVIILLYAGYLYLTSPYNPGQRGQAKKMFVAALKGYALALAGYIIVKTIVLGMIGTNDVATFIKGVFKN